MEGAALKMALERNWKNVLTLSCPLDCPLVHGWEICNVLGWGRSAADGLISGRARALVRGGVCHATVVGTFRGLRRKVGEYLCFMLLAQSCRFS